MSPIRVLIADDHRLFRQGLRHVCQAAGGIEVVGEAEDGWEAVRLAQQLKPDVILMDIQMPGQDGVEATRLITANDPPVRVIILTMYRQDQYVFEAIKAGARGYLLKDIDERELVEAIRAVHRGDALINPGLAARLLEEFRRLSRGETTGETERLTDGEMQVLRLVAQGADNKTVAERLALSERTVSNRLSEIYRKLHVNSRTQAALVALRRGWVTLEENQNHNGHEGHKG
ncbi:MAG: response regulator transcription factor [Anaerolineae bacterium]|jgi:DNA-binding NarL/FixJ family response regulator|nr:response regulator transcription factor [Anaerolineae bacterium]MDH7475512.1 response regulator transcription factor [Anaerolineae bacterium]